MIYGSEVAPIPTGRAAELHAERAYWLTGEVETGNKMGSVMMADGTAFTIGRDQHIAVYPRELAAEDWDADDDQGAAFLLLSKLEVSKSGHIQPLWDAFADEGWFISNDGHLRWLNDRSVKVHGRWVDCGAGSLVHGVLIRDAITPKGGKVVKGGDDWVICRRWATLLHNLTADPKTLALQKAFGLSHLVHRVKHRKLSPRGPRVTMEKGIYGQHNIATVRSDTFSQQFDIAMCVFHSYTVNAPSVAFTLLEQVTRTVGWDETGFGTTVEIAFARLLVRKLKEKRYGRWDKRYQRTRSHAMNCGLWPQAHFKGSDCLMPAS